MTTSAVVGFEFGDGFELSGAADENSVGGGCALEGVEEGFLFYAWTAPVIFCSG
jgi:hypothetical protein